MQNVKISLFTLLFLFIIFHAWGQSIDKNKKELIIGKWAVCQEFKLDTQYICKTNDCIYTFKLNNTYTVPPIPEQDPERVKYNHIGNWTGKWILTETELTLDIDDTPTEKFAPMICHIIWINNDLFYLPPEEGADLTIYTYYQRIK